MAYAETRHEEKEITMAVAEQFIKINTFIGQVPLKEKKIKWLTGLILKGRFLRGRIQVAKCLWSNVWVLINGQHTCHAVIRAGKSVRAFVEQYTCDTPEDLALLFRQIDNSTGRSLAEVAYPEAVALGIKWPKYTITKVIAGIGFLENHRGLALTKNDRVETLKEYIEEGNVVDDILSKASVKDGLHLRRGAVVAAMMSTVRKNVNDSKIFWGEVRDGHGENIKAHSPSLKLHKYLIATATDVGRGVNVPMLNKASSQREMYSKCIIAWNSFRRKEPVRLLKYYPEKDIPRAV